MKRKTRDYAKEYALRIERGLAGGRSRSTARGHGTPIKASVVRAGAVIDPAGKLEQALKSVKRGATLKAAAREHRIAPERLRRYLDEQTSVTRRGSRLFITDERWRRFPVFSEGGLRDPILAPGETTKASGYMRNVSKFLGSGDLGLLRPFEHEGVTDEKGKFLPFEVDPNELYQLDAAGDLSFPEIYKIVR